MAKAAPKRQPWPASAAASMTQGAGRVVQGGARKHAGADNHTLHGWKLEDKD